MKSNLYSKNNENCLTATEPIDEEDDQDEDNSQICCLTGCLTGIVAGFLFIFIVPLGFLFVVYGRNHDSPLFLVVGVLFLALPFMIFGVFATVVQCRREIRTAKESQLA